MENRKIIFCDIDGTILDSKHRPSAPSYKTSYAFNELKKNGHLVFIATGRMPTILDKEITALNPSGYLLGNGAYCIYGNDIITQSFISKEECLTIIDYCNKTDGAYFLEYPDYIATRDVNLPSYNRLVGVWKPIQTTNAKEEGYTKNPNLMMVCYEKNEDFAKCYEYLKDKVCIIPHSNHFSADINPRGCNKGYAVEKILEYFKIDPEDAYAFGDGNNDVEMFTYVNHGIAMDNASDFVKSHASEITLSVNEDGFYHSLVKHQLIKAID